VPADYGFHDGDVQGPFALGRPRGGVAHVDEVESDRVVGKGMRKRLSNRFVFVQLTYSDCFLFAVEVWTGGAGA